MLFEFLFVISVSFMTGAVAGSLYYGEPVSAMFDFWRE